MPPPGRLGSAADSSPKNGARHGDQPGTSGWINPFLSWFGMGSKPPARESLNTGSHSRKRTGEDESASGLSLDDSVDVTDPTAKRVRIDAEARESGSAKHDEAAGSRAQAGNGSDRPSSPLRPQASPARRLLAKAPPRALMHPSYKMPPALSGLAPSAGLGAGAAAGRDRPAWLVSDPDFLLNADAEGYGGLGSSRDASSPPPSDDPKANVAWGNLLSLNANVCGGWISSKPKDECDLPCHLPFRTLLTNTCVYPHVTLTGSTFKIGRHWRCNLQLLDPNISRLFCRLIYENGKVYVETLSRNGKLYVNDQVIPPNLRQPLKPGDEIAIVASHKVQYIFEMTEPHAAKDTAGAVKSAPEKTKSASEEPSFASATLAALFSKTRAAAKSVNDDTAVRLRPTAEKSEEKDKPESRVEPAAVPAAKADDKEKEKASEDEERRANLQKTLEHITKMLMERLQQHVTPHTSINVSLDDFPYYLDEEFRQQLVQAVYIYLKHPDFVKHTKSLSSMSRGVMLVGPPGTELMQLAVVRALAKHLEVNLLAFSSELLSMVPQSAQSATPDQAAKDGPSAAHAAGAGASSDAETRAKSLTPAIQAAGSAGSLRRSPRVQKQLQDSSAEEADAGADANDVTAASLDNMVSTLTDYPSSWMDGPAEINDPLEGDLVGREGADASGPDELPPGSGVAYAPNILEDEEEAAKREAEAAVSELIDAVEDALGDEDDDDCDSAGVDDLEDALDALYSDLPDILDDMPSMPSARDPDQDPVSKYMTKELRAVRKSYVFRKGDVVRYIGPARGSRSGPGGAMGRAADSWLLSSYSSLRRHAHADSVKAPPLNAEGTVVLTFPGNMRRIGVRFKQPYTGSVSIENHENCFFLPADELKVVGSHQTPDEAAIAALFRTLEKNAPCILFLRDSDHALFASNERLLEFRHELARLDKPVVVIGSSIEPAAGQASGKAASGKRDRNGFPSISFLMEKSLFPGRAQRTEQAASSPLSRLLTNRLTIRPPTDYPLLEKWNEQIKRDTVLITVEANLKRIRSVMQRNNLKLTPEEENLVKEIEELKEAVLPAKSVDMVIGWALSHHLKRNVALSAPSLPEITAGGELEAAGKGQTPGPEDTADGSSRPATPADEKDAKGGVKTCKPARKDATLRKKVEPLVLSLDSLAHAFASFSTIKARAKSRGNLLAEIQTDNEYEKTLLSNVIPSEQIGVTFGDIGALGKVKNTLFELVILPLVRPELFVRGNLTKPLKGILLFGPPGTGKTLLAKAVAVQSGANFLNISVSSITSKWVGEGEKMAKAVFTLASKITPCVIFIDEIDCLLGKRDSQTEHESMRKIKNEFMALWDGLTTKSSERVIVLAATNRPFDLDDAVLRRLPRRIMVDLPDIDNREQILRVLLRKETLEPDFDFRELARLLEGYSGSDMRNLCTAAAYVPIRELIAKEDMIQMLQTEGLEGMRTVQLYDEISAADSPRPDTTARAAIHSKQRQPPKLRPLTFNDFELAKKEVSASYSENAPSMAELRKWNEQYGESGHTWKTTLTYFT